MRYLLDTGLLIRHLRGHKSTVQLLRGLGKANRLCISTVTRLEIRAGAHADEQQITNKLLARCVNLELDARVADKAGELIAAGKKPGRHILVPDAIIAATAVVYGITLVTFNLKDFEYVSGLSLHPSSS
ncbi:MAG: type II toxin-antitoxin system VapC family toxin [Deinococcota bacterium]